METSQNYINQIRQFAKERVDCDSKVNGLMEIQGRQKEIAKALAESAYFIGVRDLGASMIDMLVRYTMTHYARFNGDKIRLAFELAIAGKTECQTDHYGNFSGIYISKVFVAYEKLEQKYMSEYKQVKEQKSLAEISANTDPIQVAKNWAPTVCEYALKIQMAKFDFDLVWPPKTMIYMAGKTMYDYFIKVGILNQDADNGDEYWRAILGGFCCDMLMAFNTAPEIADQLAILYENPRLK